MSCSVSFGFEYNFLASIYIFVFIVGLSANIWGMKSLLQKWGKLGNINIFVLNLGLADILYLLTLPFYVVYYIKRSKWIFGDTFCKITKFCFSLNLYGSIGFLTCISVYRYLAIVHPLRVKGRITVTHSVVISVMVWLLVGVQSLPDMFFNKTYLNKPGKCYDTTHKSSVEGYLKYTLGRTVTGFCIPFLITVGCYGHLIITLFRKNTIDKVQKQKSLRLLFILIVLFSVCYIPYHLLKSFNLWSRTLSNKNLCREWFNGVYIAYQISRGLVVLNSALNPLVYLHGYEDILPGLRRRFSQALQMVSSFMPVKQSSED